MKSNIQVKSNILLKSKITDSRGWFAYAPVELLIEYYPQYRDTRSEILMSEQQIEQKRRALLRATKIIDVL